MTVHYHLGNANVVAYALSRLSMDSVAHVEEERKKLARDVHRLTLLEIKEKQDNDPILLQLKGIVRQQRVEIFSQGGDGVLHY
ncbi:hypothetical protein MTR67_001532 [Solanum verrucosum]|uniref:Uncharacterized protein n=1 Tax=Solanum verrucosum TaxID=315347 RepID=A0AAF0PPE7_SOLVR|nr:hypothetical protein MTR67_001532 [Solanum verrucosum]